MYLFCIWVSGLGGSVFKVFSIFSSNGHFVLESRTISIVLVEGIMTNICTELFEFGPVVWVEMSFKCLALEAI